MMQLIDLEFKLKKQQDEIVEIKKLLENMVDRVMYLYIKAGVRFVEKKDDASKELENKS